MSISGQNIIAIYMTEREAWRFTNLLYSCAESFGNEDEDKLPMLALFDKFLEAQGMTVEKFLKYQDML